jgi:iron complex outermembrane receptor protein
VWAGAANRRGDERACCWSGPPRHAQPEGIQVHSRATDRRARGALRLLAGAIAALFLAQPRAADLQLADLADLSLEQLANIEVTSVTGKPEPLSGVPASIYVITNEDIRRSGARTLPEALRLAPNLQVARSSASGYAISARGFNNDSGLANKLLVMIDGRTVYSPLMSGVFWDQQDVMLEDVERIEVISGPGATLWGANAVNGVINVITRAAKDTQGGLATMGAGNRDLGAGLRYGGKVGPNGHYRVYGKAFQQQNTEQANGSAVPDGWDFGQGGFRADWGEPNRRVTVQGDGYTGRSEARPIFGRVEVSGVNLLARWNERLREGADFQLQAYYDRSERADAAGFQGDVDTFDIEFKHGIPLGAHRILWGGGYRRASDDVPDSLPIPNGVLPGFVISFVPPSRKLAWESIFVQDEIRLARGLELTVGIKFERNDYTGWENLPSLRLAWKPADSHLLWSAVSRAVRAPARLDRDFFFTLELAPGVALPFIGGGPTFESEIANVYEIGYRAQPARSLSVSLTAFRHDWNRLRSGETPLPGQPAMVQNMIEGITEGVEGWATWQATRSWRLFGGFTTLNKNLELKPGSTDPTGPSALGNDPEGQWMLRSLFNLTDRHEFDVFVRRIGVLPDPAVPAYTAVDARLGWRASREIDVSLILQNIFEDRHAEFGAAPARSEFARGAFVRLQWRM